MAAEYGCSRIPTDNSAMEDPSDAFFNVNEPSASRQWTQYPWNQAPHCDMSPISGSYTNRGIPYMMPVVSDQPAKFTKFRYEYELPLNSGIMTKLKVRQFLFKLLLSIKYFRLIIFLEEQQFMLP